MKPYLAISLAALLLLFVLGYSGMSHLLKIGYPTGTAASTPASSSPPPTDGKVTPESRLTTALSRLQTTKEPAECRHILKDLRQWLDSLPAAQASAYLQGFLATGQDSPTGLHMATNAEGNLIDPSSLRVFLMEYLGQVDLAAAGSQAEKILVRYTTPDEWAVALRNYAWSHPDEASNTYLVSRMKQLLDNAAWVSNPTSGLLEAFDTAVYARGTSLTPQLCVLLGRPGQPAPASHAAYLVLDRLILSDPVPMFQQLIDRPELMQGHQGTRADFLARADVSQPEQRALVEKYLLDPARTSAEIRAFAGIFPNANFMISPSLLSTPVTWSFAERAAHTQASLVAVEKWQKDPRFHHLIPELTYLHNRLAFLTSAKTSAR